MKCESCSMKGQYSLGLKGEKVILCNDCREFLLDEILPRGLFGKNLSWRELFVEVFGRPSPTWTKEGQEPHYHTVKEETCDCLSPKCTWTGSFFCVKVIFLLSLLLAGSGCVLLEDPTIRGRKAWLATGPGTVTKAERAKIMEGKVWVGMAASLARVAWGRPRAESRYSGGVEFWHYHSGSMLMIKNYKVYRVVARR